MRAVLESVASTSNCTWTLAPRAMSRPKFLGMISTPRAALAVRASSGLRSGGQETTWKEMDARNASAKSPRRGRIVQILNHQRQVMHGQRDGRRKQKQEDQRQHQRQRQRQAVAHQLGQLFACLREDASHASVLRRELAFLPGLLHHCDENVFQRIALFVDLAHRARPRRAAFRQAAFPRPPPRRRRSHAAGRRTARRASDPSALSAGRPRAAAGPRATPAGARPAGL